MARHRNVRNMRYEDELSNEEYGVSYDDLQYYAISPGTEEMFTYNRVNSKEPTLSSFMEEPSLHEEEEDVLDEEEEDNLCGSTSDYKMPKLDDVQQAKLQSGLETLEGILGENCHQPTAVNALMRFNYDVEKALDEILSKGGRQTLSLEPQSEAKIKEYETSVGKRMLERNYSSSSEPKILPTLPTNSESQTSVSIVDSLMTNSPVEFKVGESSELPSSFFVANGPSKSKDLSGLMKAPHSSTETRASLEKFQSESRLRQPLSSLMASGPRASRDLSGLMRSTLSSIEARASLKKCQSDGQLVQPLSSLMTNGPTKSRDVSGLLKSPPNSIGTTLSMEQCQNDSRLRQPLNSLMANEPSESKGVSGSMKSPLSTIGTAMSMEQCQNDSQLRQPISSLLLNGSSESKEHSGLMKSSISFIGTAISLDESQNGVLLRQPLSSLIAGGPGQSKDLSGTMKPPLSSLGKTMPMDQCQKETLLRQPLSSLMPNGPNESKDLSGLMKSPLCTTRKAAWMEQCQSDTLLKQPLSSLVNNVASESKDLSGLMKSPLSSIETTSSLQKCQSDSHIRQPLSSLMTSGPSESKDVSGLMKSPLSTIGTAVSMEQCQSDNRLRQPLSSLLNNQPLKSTVSSIESTASVRPCENDTLLRQPLSSLLSSKPIKPNQSDIVLKSNSASSSTTSAEPERRRGRLLADAIHMSPSSSSSYDMEASKFSGSNFCPSSYRNGAGLFDTPAKSSALSKLLVTSNGDYSTKMGIPSLRELARNHRTFGRCDITKGRDNFNLTPSQKQASLSYMPAKNSALSELSVTSREDSSTKMGKPSLSEIARNDMTFDSKASLGDILSKGAQQASNLMIGKGDVTDIGSRGKGFLGDTPLVMKRTNNNLTDDCSDLTSVKEMRTSLKGLSLESSLRSFPNKTPSANSSDIINMRLNEAGLDSKSSHKHLETPSAHQPGSCSFSNDFDGSLEDIVMKNQPNRTGNSVVTIRNPVRKRKASSFGQAISSLHQHRAKLPRRDLFYDNTKGFSLPVTVDLRGLPLIEDMSITTVFNFSTPSQDDKVNLKQKSAFSTKKKQTP